MVDLAALSTEDAINRTIEYIEQYKELGEKIKLCLINNSDIIQGTKNYLKKYIESLKNADEKLH